MAPESSVITTTAFEKSFLVCIFSHPVLNLFNSIYRLDAAKRFIFLLKTELPGHSDRQSGMVVDATASLPESKPILHISAGETPRDYFSCSSVASSSAAIALSRNSFTLAAGIA